MGKHTPGSWFNRPDHDPIRIMGASEVGLSLAFVCGGGDERREEYKANARLIAWSSDLLDASKRVDAEIMAWRMSGKPDLGKLNEAHGDLISAIAKATGESHG